MKVLIIEDEAPIAQLLKRFLQKIDPSIEVIAMLSSIKESVEWFNSNPEPDLVFMDVQLTDGNSFEIFDRIIIECPVIFTTGHDAYALKAFKVNSIDYLLKPINPGELEKSILKYYRLTNNQANDSHRNFEGLLQHFNIKKPDFKTRFLVKSGQTLVTVPTEEVAYFCTENKLVFLYTKQKKRYVIDSTLDELTNMIDTNGFFRINRQFIVSFGSIKAIHNYFNGRLKLELEPASRNEMDVIISSKKVAEFKQWLDK